MRRANKVDLNQQEIVAELRKFGISVEVDHHDILVGYGGTYWFEIKTPDKVGKNGKIRPSALQPSQVKLLKEWRGHYSVVWDIKQILEEIGYNI